MGPAAFIVSVKKPLSPPPSLLLLVELDDWSPGPPILWQIGYPFGLPSCLEMHFLHC